MDPKEPKTANDVECSLESDDALIEALAIGKSQTEAGRIAGVSKRTVARRVADPQFAASVERRRTAHIEEVIGSLGAIANEAVKVLGSALTEERSSERIRAAESVLRLLLPFRRHQVVEHRVAKIEEDLKRGGIYGSES